MEDQNKNNISVKNILVTGGTGLLGSHLIKQLVSQDQKVYALYRTTVGENPNDNKINWINADILDIVALENAMENMHHVYHCAGVISFDPEKKKELFKVNIEGTANVVNACINKKIQKLLFVSSVSALGKNVGNNSINETINWLEEDNNSAYSKSKHLAEMQVWRGIGEGLNAVIINPSTILGAGDWNKGSTAIFKSVYNEFPWYTNGINGFVDVDDVVNAMILLMQSDIVSERFIVSTTNISYKELFDMIAKEFGKKMPSKKVTPLIAAVVWRVEKLKSKLNHSKPLLTKETAITAQSKVFFDNTKLLKALPAFSYKPIQKSIKRICEELKKKYDL